MLRVVVRVFFFVGAIGVAGLFLTGCGGDETAQIHKKGVYTGAEDTPLSEAQIEKLQERTQFQAVLDNMPNQVAGLPGHGR